MASVRRSIKREVIRATRAKNARERALQSAAFEIGLNQGIQMQKDKVLYATLGMSYGEEYVVNQQPKEEV